MIGGRRGEAGSGRTEGRGEAAEWRWGEGQRGGEFGVKNGDLGALGAKNGDFGVGVWGGSWAEG